MLDSVAEEYAVDAQVFRLSIPECQELAERMGAIRLEDFQRVPGEGLKQLARVHEGSPRVVNIGESILGRMRSHRNSVDENLRIAINGIRERLLNDAKMDFDKIYEGLGKIEAGLLEISPEDLNENYALAQRVVAVRDAIVQKLSEADKLEFGLFDELLDPLEVELNGLMKKVRMAEAGAACEEWPDYKLWKVAKNTDYDHNLKTIEKAKKHLEKHFGQYVGVFNGGVGDFITQADIGVIDKTFQLYMGSELTDYWRVAVVPSRKKLEETRVRVLAENSEVKEKRDRISNIRKRM